MQDTMRTEIKKRIAPERIPGVYRDTGAGIYLRLMTREDTDRIQFSWDSLVKRA